jgi:putative transcriptional regulator
MATRVKANTRLTKELLETVKDMRASGIMDKAAHEKITMRHLGDADAIPIVAPSQAAISARCVKKRT